MIEPTTTTNDARWVPACGGTETWAKARDGREYLYVWWQNAPESTPANLRHGWLDRNDVIRHDDPNAPCHPDDGCACCW